MGEGTQIEDQQLVSHSKEREKGEKNKIDTRKQTYRGGKEAAMEVNESVLRIRERKEKCNTITTLMRVGGGEERYAGKNWAGGVNPRRLKPRPKKTNRRTGATN